METTVGIFLVFGLLALAYMTVKLGDISLFGDKGYPLFARFTTVTGLRVGSSIYIAGIRVGQVQELSFDQENNKALVKLDRKSVV